MPKKASQEEVIKAFVGKHGETYDYSKVVYSGAYSHVTIICKLHGEFTQNPKNHQLGQGCPVCGKEKQKADARSRSVSITEFIDRSNKKHNSKYDYSKVLPFNSTSDNVTIVCPVHGEFSQIVNHHLRGSGCPKCHWAKHNPIPKMTTEQFVAKAQAIGANATKYDYSETIYDGNNKKVAIRCLKHGIFTQLANDHLSKKAGCPRCAGVVRLTDEEFALRGHQVHNNKYSYEKTDYVNTMDKVIITCPTHGDFLQSPHDHISSKAGCPSCGCSGISQAENDLKNFIVLLGFDVVTRNREIIKPYEMDIVVPSKKVAFEYNGIYYHSDKFDKTRSRHKTKTDMSRAVGYKLVHIYEDDWRDRRSVVEKTIKHILGVSEKKLFARKLSLVEKDSSDVKEFFNSNHMQGASSGKAWCLLDGDEIVAAMQFKQSSSERGNKDSTRIELARYATSCHVVGGVSRLFKAYLSANKATKTIVSYSDNDMFDGAMYEMLGFVKDSDVKQDYKVVVGGNRVHKANFKREKIAVNYPHVYSELKSEQEMCLELGYYRIYNSGLTKWVFNQP